MKYFTNKMLQIEERARKYFERLPFTHAFIAGVGMTLVWRGVWMVADEFNIGGLFSIILGVVTLGAIGLFVQTFVGNAIIIKKVDVEKDIEKRQEKEIEQVEKEIKKEGISLEILNQKLENLNSKIDKLIK
jgi:hypothetical protein